MFSSVVTLDGMAATAVVGTLTGCVGCVLDIESISKISPGCMNLMTFATFVCISSVGLFKQSKGFTAMPSNKISITRGYMPIVMLFFFVNVSDNQSLNFDISMPLFIIFRSGTLLSNLVLGRVLIGRVYSWRKLFAVLLVTAGVILFTLASNTTSNSSTNNRPLWVSALPFPPFVLGLAMMTSALFVSAYLGIRQEQMYRTYGKHPEEAMFFIHVLSLPGFFLLSGDIWQTCERFNQSPPLHLLGVSMPIPSLWAQLISICLLQWVCISNIYALTSQTNSLNVTMVTTLRKFISLALSICVFDNPFNWMHASGALSVLIGTLLFTDVNLSITSLFYRTSVQKRD